MSTVVSPSVSRSICPVLVDAVMRREALVLVARSGTSEFSIEIASLLIDHSEGGVQPRTQ